MAAPAINITHLNIQRYGSQSTHFQIKSFLVPVCW